ncbi:MAG: hypothetical protein AB7N76_06695 [Planctomycetota bacterium]
MFLKALYGACIGLVAFTLLFLAPHGSGLVASASPEKVERDPNGGPIRPGGASRGPRYVWSGYRGK